MSLSIKKSHIYIPCSGSLKYLSNQINKNVEHGRSEWAGWQSETDGSNSTNSTSCPSSLCLQKTRNRPPDVSVSRKVESLYTKSSFFGISIYSNRFRKAPWPVEASGLLNFGKRKSMCLLSLSLHKMKLLNIASVYISKICWRTSCDLRLLCPKVIAIIYTKTKRLLLHAPRLLCHSTKTRMALHNVSVYHKNSHLYTYTVGQSCVKYTGLSRCKNYRISFPINTALAV
jgi:hypothetical protein